jgi:hypothetical protein
MAAAVALKPVSLPNRDYTNTKTKCGWQAGACGSPTPVGHGWFDRREIEDEAGCRWMKKGPNAKAAMGAGHC